MTYHAALSPSRINDFRQCPLKFRFLKIDKLPQPPSLEAVRGTLVHAVLENLFLLKPAERTEAAALTLLNQQWENYQKAHPEVMSLFSDDLPLDEWLEGLPPLVTAYFSLENPQRLEPAAREKSVSVQLPNGIHITGKIDRVDRSADGALRVIDYKTGKSGRIEYAADKIFQLRFYATAIYIATGILPKRLQLLFLGNTRSLTIDPTMDVVPQTVTEIDQVWQDMEKRLDSGVWEPKQSKLCGWCPFHHYCPVWDGTPPQINQQGVDQLRTVKSQLN
ncbi:MAG: PD-(D/E)XK nuclease family protein [Actinomycetaceae bacterium]|nr:PD-(D/E)XK nuclease family protein [Actinomycetaceae bacterium]MDY6083215.1 PD-(D/E)XK nuclease family protein [Actinomycetaceae bacterium]